MSLRLVYLLAYVLILSAVFFIPAWRALDWQLFSVLHQSAAPRWGEELAIIDVPYVNDRGQFSLIDYRARLGALMRYLARGTQGRPTAVLFDIAFGREVEGIEPLTRGLIELSQSGVKRYAAIDPSIRPASFGDISSVSAPLRQVDGVGHTAFQQRSGVLVYASEIVHGDGTVISAMPVRIAKDLLGRPEAGVAEMITVRIGAKEAYRQHTWRWEQHAEHAERLAPLVNEVRAQLDKRVVIIGSLDEDSNRFAGRSGPELLAWALLARMAHSDEPTGPRALDSPPLFAGLLIVLPAGSAVVFRAVRSRMKGTSARTWWASCAAVLFGLVCLIILVAVIYALGHLYTQVTLVFIAVIVAVAIACFAVFHEELLASLQADLESGKLQAAETYDVFISYSRDSGNAKWVEEQVFKPLCAARRVDGTPLNIFFDTRSIRVGDFWYRRLALAIAGSRYFVAVYSDDYFKKAFCLHELTLALARSAQKPDFVLPLLRTSDPVPPGFDHIQHIDVRQKPDFIEELLARCLA